MQATILVIEHFYNAAHDPLMSTLHKLTPQTASEMTPERIGMRLSMIREANNLTRAEMSDLLDIERTYWSRFENGKRPVTDVVAAQLVERFDVTLDFIILGRWDRLPFDVAQKLRASSK